MDKGGDPVEDGTGEVYVRGASLFSGYWPDGQGGPDNNGWFATGDVAVVDDDGDLRLVDRRKELILVSGFNVYPREVERVIEEIPGVAEVAVIGVAHPVLRRDREGVPQHAAGREAGSGGRGGALRAPSRPVQVPHERRGASRTAALVRGQDRPRSVARNGRCMTSRVELITRPGCHLCDVARQVVESVCADAGPGLRRAGHHATTRSWRPNTPTRSPWCWWTVPRWAGTASPPQAIRGRLDGLARVPRPLGRHALA